MAYTTEGVTAGTWYGPSDHPGIAGGNTAGQINMSGTFIPEVWSGKLVEKFYDATVLAAIANTDYEGEIRGQGDLVKIRTKPTLAITITLLVSH